jgi:hypothetical protein
MYTVSRDVAVRTSEKTSVRRPPVEQRIYGVLKEGYAPGSAPGA